MDLAERVWVHRELVAEVRRHNCGVIIRRRAGADWTAPENQYRSALAEIEAMHD